MNSYWYETNSDAGEPSSSGVARIADPAIMVVEFYECNTEMALIQQHGGSRSLAATDERACVRIYTSDDVTRDDYN